MVKKILLFLLLLFVSPNVWATTWYIRTDGGTASQCTGTTDAQYPGSGTSQPCALNHPNWSFPPRGENTSRSAQIGDTVIIHGPEAGSGVYRIGCQNSTNCLDASVNLTVGANCASAYPYDCWEQAIPNNVTFIGCSSTGCSTNTKPILWGAGKVTHILSANSKSNVTISDMELTDHEACGSANSTYPCNASASGLSALDGIDTTGSTNLIAKNLYIHGIGRYAFYGGSNTNPLYDHLNIDKNSYGGINWDSCGNSTCGENGNIILNFTTVSFSGCIENYPPTAGQANLPGGITQCYDQNSTGYGDGIASNVTGGNFYFYYSDISHNVQDGIDLLYHNNTGLLFISRTRTEGNTGNQIKTGANQNIIENSKIIGNCQYFATMTIPRNAGFTNCRADGTALVVAPALGQLTSIKGTTLWGESGTIIDNGSSGNANTCNGTETMTLINDLAFGEPSVSGSGSNSSYFYCSGSNGDGAGSCCSGGTALHPSVTYSDIWNTKDAPVSGTGNINQNPLVNQGTNMSPEPATNNFDMTLTAPSPMRAVGSSSITFVNGPQDFNNYPRSPVDMAGFQYGTSYQCIPDTLFCEDASDCCGGGCNANACITGSCVSNGGACSINSDCCSNYCSGSVCANAPTTAVKSLIGSFNITGRCNIQ